MRRRTVIGAIPVTVAFSESVSGFSAAGLIVTNATVVNFSGSGSSYSFTLTPAVTPHGGGAGAVLLHGEPEPA